MRGPNQEHIPMVISVMGKRSGRTFGSYETIPATRLVSHYGVPRLETRTNIDNLYTILFRGIEAISKGTSPPTPPYLAIAMS